MFAFGLQSASWGLPTKRPEASLEFRMGEATTGFEPVIAVLQIYMSHPNRCQRHPSSPILNSGWTV